MPKRPRFEEDYGDIDEVEDKDHHNSHQKLFSSPQDQNSSDGGDSDSFLKSNRKGRRRRRNSDSSDQEMEDSDYGEERQKPMTFQKAQKNNFENKNEAPSSAANRTAASNLFVRATKPPVDEPILPRPSYFPKATTTSTSSFANATPSEIVLPAAIFSSSSSSQIVNGIPQGKGEAMAARFMAKFGFKGRLGKHEQGIAAPIVVMARPEGVGLGRIEEATTLPENRANTEHLERLQKEAKEKEQKLRAMERERKTVESLWRKDAFTEAHPLLQEDETLSLPANHPLLTALHAMKITVERSKAKEQAATRALEVFGSLNAMHNYELLKTESALERVVQKRVALQSVLGKVLKPLQNGIATRDLAHVQSGARKLVVIPVTSRTDARLDRAFASAVQDAAKLWWATDVGFVCDVVDVLFDVCSSTPSPASSPFPLPTPSPLTSTSASPPQSLPSSQAIDLEDALRHTLVRVITPRLEADVESWTPHAPISLDALLFPWLPAFASDLERLVQLALGAVERAVRSWPNLEDVDGVENMIRPLRRFADEDTLVRGITRAISSRLAKDGGASAVKLWYERGLLAAREASCILELCAIKPLVLALEKDLLPRFWFADACSAYETVLKEIPLPLIVRQARGRTNRIRAHLDACLERMRAALDENDPDPAILRASAPLAETFPAALDAAKRSGEWGERTETGGFVVKEEVQPSSSYASYHRNHPNTYNDEEKTNSNYSGGRVVPSTSTSAWEGDNAKVDVRALLELRAAELGLPFILDPHGRTHLGKTVYLFGKILVTTAEGVIFARIGSSTQGQEAWSPVSLRELAELVVS